MALARDLEYVGSLANPAVGLAALAGRGLRAAGNAAMSSLDGTEGGGAAFGRFPQMPTGGTVAPQPLAAQAQVRAVDNNPQNTSALTARPLASLATPMAPATPSAPALQAPDQSLAARVMSTLPAGVTRDGNSYSGSNIGAPPGAPTGGDPTRPYPLGSLADTQFQTASLQRSNTAAPGAGLTIIDSTGDRDLRNAAVSANSLANRVRDRRGNSVVDPNAPAVQAYTNALSSRAQMEKTGAEQAGADYRAGLSEQGLASRALMTDARQAQSNALDQQKLGVTLQHYQNQDANEKAKIAVEAGKANATKPLTDGQSKALLFGSRMQASNKILGDLQAQGKMFSTPGANAPYVGGVVNLFNSEQGQQLDQAKRDFLNATLRRESGAVISPAEFDNGDKQYFPQPGDSPKVIEQKRQNREVAIRGVLAEVPDAETRAAAVAGPTQRVVKRSGVLNGRRVVEYSDGTSGYVD